MKPWIGKAFVVALFAVTVGVYPTYAESISIRATAGATTVTVADNSAGDLDATLGVITWSASSAFKAASGWELAFTVGQGSQFLGPANMDFTYVATNSTGGTTNPLVLEFTQTGTNPPVLVFTSSIGGSIDSGMTMAYTVFTDINDVAFSQASPLGTLNTFGSLSGNVLTDSSYSVTQFVSVTSSAAGQTASGNARLSPAVVGVPEPSSLLLLGTSLGGIALWGRRRIKA